VQHHLYVGGVGGGGEVVVHGFVWTAVTRGEHVSDVVGGSIYLSIGSWLGMKEETSSLETAD